MYAYLGEIRLFAGNYAPQDWALCDGQQLSVSQNQALFSLYGVTYGGNGSTVFNLPDLRGRIPVHFGQGTGLTLRPIGSSGGTETVTLDASQIPAHTHSWMATTNVATTNVPTNNVLTNPGTGNTLYEEPPQANQLLTTTALINPTGGSQTHPNMMPYLAINFIVALQGEYPQRP